MLSNSNRVIVGRAKMALQELEGEELRLAEQIRLCQQDLQSVRARLMLLRQVMKGEEAVVPANGSPVKVPRRATRKLVEERVRVCREALHRVQRPMSNEELHHAVNLQLGEQAGSALIVVDTLRRARGPKGEPLFRKIGRATWSLAEGEGSVPDLLAPNQAAEHERNTLK